MPSKKHLNFSDSKPYRDKAITLKVETYLSILAGSISLLSGTTQIGISPQKLSDLMDRSGIVEQIPGSPSEKDNLPIKPEPNSSKTDKLLVETSSRSIRKSRFPRRDTGSTIIGINALSLESMFPTDKNISTVEYVNHKASSGSLEITFRDLNLKLENVDTEVLYRTAGVFIALYVIRDVFACCKTIQRNRTSAKALDEAERSFAKMISELYDTLQHSSPEDSKLIVLFDHRERPYNIFDDKVIEIRNRIESYLDKYEGKVNPQYLEAVQQLRECTILYPRDINLMKAQALKLSLIGKKPLRLRPTTIKLLADLTFKLPLLKK